MNDEKYTNVYDFSWREVYSDSSSRMNSESQNRTCETLGQIRFKQSKKRSNIRRFIKSMTLILVASVSGAIAGAYIVEKKYSNSNGYILSQNIFTSPNANSIEITQLPKSTITKVVEIVGPAVVGISSNAENFFTGTINQFTGSGIVVRQDGVIVTNYHIIEGSDKIYVKLSGGGTAPVSAKLLTYDKAADLAVIKIDITGLPVASFGDSSKVRVGDIAVAIGNPLGEEFIGTVTQGIISATNRKVEVVDQVKGVTDVYRVLQTDAAINLGNSGGPLVNELGEIIAISNVKFGKLDNTQSMGFAISSNEVKKVIDNILSDNKVSRPILGIEGSYYEDKDIKGVYVRQVYLGAAEAGIVPTDIIMEVAGVKVIKADQISEILNNFKVGDSVTCKVLRDDKKIDFTIQLKEK